MTNRLRVLLIPGGFALGAAACAFALRHAPAAVDAGRMQPLTVVTYWHAFGGQMWLALALAACVAAIGYVWTLRVPRPLATTVLASALACAAALLFPVVFSSDVYAYAGYGDMALHGISPYAHARIAHGDPLLDAMVWQWGNPPPMCVYGPAFVWLAQAIVAVFLPLGPAAPLWALRVLACLCLVLCAPLAYGAFGKFPQATRLAAAAGIALNPIAIWSSAEGHNDAIALAIVLGGFALVRRSRLFAGALAVALSALVKAPGALAAMLLALTSWRDRARFRALGLGSAAGIAAVLALAVPLEYGVRTQLAPHGHYLPQFSLQYVSIPIAAIAIVLLVLRAWFDRAYAWHYLALAAWLAIPNPYPWYALWLLPVAFLAWRSSAAYALLALSLLSVLRYYPDATDAAFSRPGGVAIALVQIAIPLAFMAARTVSARRDLREIRTPAPGFAPPRSP